MNKYKDHVYVIPEDDADRQIADGFVQHHEMDDRRIQVMPVANGWSHLLDTFKQEYIQLLKNNLKAHVVMLIDFDGQFEERRARFQAEIPEVIEGRVFVVGSKINPETLKQAIHKTFEEIGSALAGDCATGNTVLWEHEQLSHNDPDRRRLEEIVKPFLFSP